MRLLLQADITASCPRHSPPHMQPGHRLQLTCEPLPNILLLLATWTQAGFLTGGLAKIERVGGRGVGEEGGTDAARGFLAALPTSSWKSSSLPPYS